MSTSHQLRSALQKRGWQVQDSKDEVRLLMPGEAATEIMVEAVLGAPSEGGPADESGDSSFAPESQLRDFIAQNLARIPINGTPVPLYTDASGRSGVEYPTAVGPIDILAFDQEWLRSYSRPRVGTSEWGKCMLAKRGGYARQRQCRALSINPWAAGTARRLELQRLRQTRAR